MNEFVRVAPYWAMLGDSGTGAIANLLEDRTGRHVLDIGFKNAGVGAFLNARVLALAAGAERAIVQVTGAHNISNAFYTVHPRRNDRFIDGSPSLRGMFPEVDFTEIHFTRHLLATLRAASEDRFECVAAELRTVWQRRMTRLLAALPAPLLLWAADHPAGEGEMDCVPALVSRRMLAALDVADLVEVTADTHSIVAALVPYMEGAPEGAPSVHTFAVNSGTRVNRSPTSP